MKTSPWLPTMPLQGEICILASSSSSSAQLHRQKVLGFGFMTERGFGKQFPFDQKE
jgi:hypothetical protein